MNFCDVCIDKMQQYEKKKLFEFARMLNNYRRFESDEDVYHLIDLFLSSYDTCNQPDSSKREDGISLDEWHKRQAFGPYADAVLGTSK